MKSTRTEVLRVPILIYGMSSIQYAIEYLYPAYIRVVGTLQQNDTCIGGWQRIRSLINQNRVDIKPFGGTLPSNNTTTRTGTWTVLIGGTRRDGIRGTGIVQYCTVEW